MPRPGGNPDFGIKQKFEQFYEEPVAKKQLQIRLPQSIQNKLDQMTSDERNQLVRSAIATALFGQKSQDSPLIEEAITFFLENKRAAIARERKLKLPNQKLIEQWQKEIEELEVILG